jgi:hypothetical protein
MDVAVSGWGRGEGPTTRVGFGMLELFFRSDFPLLEIAAFDSAAREELAAVGQAKRDAEESGSVDRSAPIPFKDERDENRAGYRSKIKFCCFPPPLAALEL